MHHNKFQWRIQNFPDGGATPKVEEPTYYFGNLPSPTLRNLHEIEKIGPKGKELASVVPPGSAKDNLKVARNEQSKAKSR